MPIYEFICGECNIQFETIVASSAGQDSVECKNCGSKNIKKMISTPGLRISASSGSSSNAPLGMGSGGCSSRPGFS